MSAVDRLMKGAIDMHVHVGPDSVRERRLDALDLAIQGKETGITAHCPLKVLAPEGGGGPPGH